MQGFENWFNGGLCLAQKMAAQAGSKFVPPQEWVSLAQVLRAAGINTIPVKKFWEQEDDIRADDDTPIKKAIHWNGYQIGLQYQSLDQRHGRILPLGYGEFLGIVSDHDGMNANVYVGPDLESDRVFAITQLNAETGAFDEVKFIIGVDKPIDEVANLYKVIMTPDHFGGIEEIEKDAIGSYQPKTWVRRPAQITDAIEDAPNYRKATGDQRCENCQYSRTARPNGTGWLNCDEYDFECDRDSVCDSYASKKVDGLPPEGSQDAEPLQVEGDLLSEKDWEALADVSNADAEAALKQWKKTAPEQFVEILDAGEADETSN